MHGTAKTLVSLSIALACCGILVSPGASARSEGPPTAQEIVRLPKFCWGKYNTSLTDPQYVIDGCGVGMNHYCPALVSYNRSFGSVTPVAKKQYLERALVDVEYTLDYMRRNVKEFPNCPIRMHAENTRSMVRRAMGLPPLPNDAFPSSTTGPGSARSTGNAQVASPPSAGRSSEASVNQPTASRDGQPQQPQEKAEATTAPLSQPKTKSGASPNCRFCPD
jgi:hypothetical protein